MITTCERLRIPSPFKAFRECLVYERKPPHRFFRRFKRIMASQSYIMRCRSSKCRHFLTLHSNELGHPKILRNRIPFCGLNRKKVTKVYSFFFGLFAPYFDRDVFRSFTEAESRAPRTIWYRTPGRSRTRPPRTRTTECS